MSVVKVSHLAKTYGAIKAVADFGFSAGKGEIVALVGPDGAGKSSIFRAMCGLLEFDAGKIEISGFDVRRDFDRIKPLLGYMPQTFSLYPDLSVEENLCFYAGLFGLGRGEFQKKKELLYEFSGLGPFHKRRASALSGGMKQKLALSCALVHDPHVLVLDEPTTGVDPLSRRQFWNILEKLRSQGSSIMVSTPYMDEVELSDRAVFMYSGRKMAEGPPDELLKQFAGKVYRLDLLPTSQHMKHLEQIGGLTCRRFGTSIHVYVPENRSIEDYRDELSRTGVEQHLITLVQPELEDVFIQLMGK